MSFFFRKGGLKLSGKMMLFFVALVLVQSLVTLTILTAIISRTNLDSLKSQISDTILSVEGYLKETISDLRVKGALIAGQQTTIDYTEFRLKNLLARELTIFKESLGIESLTVFVSSDDVPFTGTQAVLGRDPQFKEQLAGSFQGCNALFISQGDGGTSLFILSPIKRGDRIIGVLSLGLSVDQAFATRIEKIINTRVVLRFKDVSIHDGTLSENQISQVMAAYERLGGGEGKIAKAAQYILGARDLDSLGLSGGTVYCLMDTAESTRQIKRYNGISLLATFLILTLALVSGIVFYRRTFFNKFQTILLGITSISRGDFNPPFQLPWQDEFGQLALAFDDMCRKLLIRDATQKTLEEKLALSTRLAALGEMAAGVAHQIRNPLVVMKVSTEMLRDNFAVGKDAEKYRKLTHLILDEIDALNLVVSNFLDFARPRKILRAPMSVKSVVEFALESLPLDHYPGITVRTVIADDLPQYPMDRSLMTQALANLILNALQASPAGASVEVRARAAAGRLRVEVQDWGTGIEEEIMRNIWNPFFTTRDSGTGLGLSIVHRIIESHGGSIDVRSCPGKGSTFTVLLSGDVSP